MACHTNHIPFLLSHAALTVATADERLDEDPVEYLSKHLNMCPNGHVYLIGNCGGATQTSSCAECGATIGGNSYGLEAGNARADELVGRFRALQH